MRSYTLGVDFKLAAPLAALLEKSEGARPANRKNENASYDQRLVRANWL